jgi:hypothetical protein
MRSSLPLIGRHSSGIAADEYHVTACCSWNKVGVLHCRNIHRLHPLCFTRFLSMCLYSLTLLPPFTHSLHTPHTPHTAPRCHLCPSGLPL